MITKRKVESRELTLEGNTLEKVTVYRISKMGVFMTAWCSGFLLWMGLEAAQSERPFGPRWWFYAALGCLHGLNLSYWIGRFWRPFLRQEQITTHQDNL